MLRTRFTDLVGCTVPIQQSPMGSFARPRLAAAVSAAGGLGMVVVTGEEPGRIAKRLDEALEMSPGPIGANFFLLMCDPETLPACVATAAARAQVIDFFYRDPDPALVGVVHAPDAPDRLSTGIDSVWVAGQRVYVNGAVTDARPGQVIRPGD